MSDLSDRKKEVLFAVVENFISTAEPVGSLQISKTRGISLSPASIRHVMAELEELGFLARPHTSAGGVPTDRAFRFYVDRLVQLETVPTIDQHQIHQRIEDGAPNFHELLKDACRLISDRSHQPGMILAPIVDQRSLKHIQFVQLKNNLVLAILVTSNGIVENKLLEVGELYRQDELNRMHNYLNERLSGMTITQVRQEIMKEMQTAHEHYDALLRSALVLGEQALTRQAREFHVEGQSHLLSGLEFSNLDRMRQILRTLEQKTEILQILDQAIQNPGIKIWIGEEMPFSDINGLSLITSTYSDSEGNRGVLGVIGPTRLNYARIIPLVDFTAQMLTEVLDTKDK